MLSLSDAHTLASMLAEELTRPARQLEDWADTVAEITGESVEYREGTCKAVLTIGKQWVIKYASPNGRVGNSDESEEEFLAHLEAEQPELLKYFMRSHRVTENWTIQEYVTVSESWYETVQDEVYDVTSQCGAGDVFWKNVGYRRDGTWVIFDFDA